MDYPIIKKKELKQEIKMSDIEYLFGLVDKIAELESKLPYHFNLMDELKTNENAHSKLLVKLLSYKNQNGFPFLQAFLNRVGIEKEVKKSTITAGEKYIDCLIRDDGYAVIIENKIHNAKDQEEQIDGYVKTVKKEYPPEEIYVIYLTSLGRKKVTESSMPVELRQELCKRFIECNYRDHILPWLKEDVLPQCQLKEELLISATHQYIDHLNGMFLLRSNQHQMKEEIKSYLKKNSKGKDFEEIIGDIRKLLGYLETIENEKINKKRNIPRKKFLEELYEKLGKEEWDCVTYIDTKVPFENANDDNFGFMYKGDDTSKAGCFLNGEKVSFHVEIQSPRKNTYNNRKFLCGAFVYGNSELGKELKEKFKKELPGTKINSTKYWVYMDTSEYRTDEGYNVAKGFYDDIYNDLFTNDTHRANILEVFAKQVDKMKKVWLKICQEETS